MNALKYKLSINIKFLYILIMLILLSCSPANEVKQDVVEIKTIPQESNLMSLYQSLVPGVVTISANLPMGPSTGSGFLWNEEGYVVTNSHVVRDANFIDIKFSDGVTMEAKLIAQDVYSDLAVLSVDYPDSYVIYPLNHGNSNRVQVGEMAIAIGSPFGEEFTLTKGIVSATGRSRPDLETNFQIGSVIQHDASINPGNSGGPLFDSQGNVIGINAQIASKSGSNSGIGFAIPINTAKKVIPSLINNKVYKHSYLGISSLNLNFRMIKALDLPRLTQGVVVTYIDNNGPSGSSDLKIDDIITHIENYKIKSFSELVNFLTDSTIPGSKISLTVIRDNETLEIDIILGERPVVK